MQFARWYDAACAAGVRQPDAMTLATVAADGTPDARTVLLRGLDARGFAFYTNLESAKARELTAHPTAALVFHWRELERQVRVTGPVAAGSRPPTRRGTGSSGRAGTASAPGRHRRATWWTPTGSRPTARRRRGALRRRRSAAAAVLGWLRRRRSATLELWQGRTDRLHDRVRYRAGDDDRYLDPRATRTVNPTALVALIVTGVFALGDWWSRVRDDKRLEYVCKPATLTALIVVAVALDPASGASDRRAWFVAALVFSLLGDVFLMLPRDAFVPGLAAFLVAHVCYVVGFWTDPPAAVAMVIAAVIVVAGRRARSRRTVLRALASEPALRPPVAIYMVVIAHDGRLRDRVRQRHGRRGSRALRRRPTA